MSAMRVSLDFLHKRQGCAVSLESVREINSQNHREFMTHRKSHKQHPHRDASQMYFSSPVSLPELYSQGRNAVL